MHVASLCCCGSCSQAGGAVILASSLQLQQSVRTATAATLAEEQSVIRQRAHEVEQRVQRLQAYMQQMSQEQKMAKAIVDEALKRQTQTNNKKKGLRFFNRLRARRPNLRHLLRTYSSCPHHLALPLAPQMSAAIISAGGRDGRSGASGR